MAAHSEEHGNAGGKTVFVRNLPYTTTNDSLEQVFSDIGPIKQCFVVSDKEGGKCRGFGYVKFTLLEDAQKALDTVKKVNGRAVQLMFAKRKEKKKKFGQPKAPPKTTELEESFSFEDLKPDVKEIKEEPDVTKQNKNSAAKLARLERVKKEPKAHNEGKRARLIVRNLSFKCSEKQLREAFAKYGTIEDVHIPTKDGGKKRGFAFVQYLSKAQAGMAVKALNGKPILDRKVAVDFTLPKDKFELKVAAAKSTAKTSEPAVDENEADSDDSMEVDEIEEVKEEPDEDVKEEEDKESDDGEEEAEDSSADSDESESDDEVEENDDGSSDDDDDEGMGIPKRKFDLPQDVDQGRTVFIRNVPFDSQDEDLEEYFTQFGQVRFARCVVDNTTGISKGTAFVQFSAKESVALCLKGSAQSGQHQLKGRELLVTLAVDRDTAQDLRKDKKKLPKDSRNLYLAREGMIRPGTEAAKDVSATDLAKRLRNDAMKRRKLKDQNTFISSTRLCVHNIPATVTDQSLKEIILKTVSGLKKFNLTEVRIMRDLNRVSPEGVGKSRGYGFVGFRTHETALSALEQLNNNSKVFGPNKRPIVEFSIENRKALLTKEKRLEKTKMRLNQEMEKAAMTGVKNKFKSKRKPKQLQVDRKGEDKVARSMHSGPLGLPRHSGPKQRHKPRLNQTQGKTKKPKGFVHPAKANLPRRQREPKPRQETSRRKKGRTDIDSFDKLVASHKKKILSSGAGF